jgi:hypothetical protein
MGLNNKGNNKYIKCININSSFNFKSLVGLTILVITAAAGLLRDEADYASPRPEVALFASVVAPLWTTV